MVSELLKRSSEADPNVEVFAHTLAENNASSAILRKLGFEFVGELTHPEDGIIWEWRRKSI
jgi:[ribosomal protein S5]-alanine N-acetyltransferase